MKFPILLLALSASIFAQQPVPAAAPSGSMFLGIGGTYNHYAPSPTMAGTADFGVQIGSTSFYSISTLVLQPQVATVRSGVGYAIRHSGPITVIGMMDGGLTTATAASTLSVAGVSLGNVGGGILVRYDLGSRWKSLAGLGILGGVRETAVTSTSVSPEFIFKISYYLK